MTLRYTVFILVCVLAFSGVLFGAPRATAAGAGSYQDRDDTDSLSQGLDQIDGAWRGDDDFGDPSLKKEDIARLRQGRDEHADGGPEKGTEERDRRD